MGDDITIGVTEIVNNIEVTAQPNDQVIDIEVIDNSDDVTLNVTPNVIEVNINKGSSYARWGSIFGNLTDQADLTNALFNKADLVDGKVPSYQLPSFVDDVIEVANYAALPTVGEIGKIYITLDDNKIYRWSGSIYIEIASNQAIWGAITGSLTNQTDLVNALNLKADKSTTLTINGTTFDLSANRTYTIPTHDAVTLGTANGLSLSGQVLSLGLSGASSTGALSSTDWNTFNNKLSSLSGAVLTTTDQSVAGVKTFTNLSKFTNNTGSFAVEIDTTSSDSLVIKNAGTTTLQIGKNGEILAAKYRISGGFSSQFLKANGDLDSTVYTPASRTITINGVTQDLTANRSFTVATHDAVTIGTANGLSLSGQALSLALASGSTTGALSSTDWTTFNNKQNALNGAGFVKISGTTISYDNNTYALDSAVVTLATDQTISGQKTFLNNVNIDAGINLDDAFGLYWKTNVGAIETALAGIGQSSSGLNFFTGSSLSTPKMVITSGGNVGINGSSLDINPSSGNPNITLRTGNTFRGYIEGNSNGLSFGAGSGANIYFTLLNNGYVGIGTNNPSSLLHIQSSASGGQNIRLQTSIANGRNYIQFANGSGDMGYIGYGGADNKFSIFNQLNDDVLFATNSTERMRITSGGNVGIGTTSPSGLLHLASGSDMYFKMSRANGGFASQFYRNAGAGTLTWQSILSDNTTTHDFIICGEADSSHAATKIVMQPQGGNVGIGTTSPVNKLQIGATTSYNNNAFAICDGTNDFAIFQASSLTQLYTNGGFLFATNSTERMRITSGGSVVVNNLGTGLVYSNAGALTSTNPSDERLKDDITDLQYGLNEILQLRPVSYNWKNDTINQGKQFGFIAQEVQEVMPELISEFTTTEDEEEVVRLGLDKEGIYATLVNAIKELKAEIELLKQK